MWRCGSATCSGDVIDACEWHLAQLTLIQITISLASIVWDTHKRERRRCLKATAREQPGGNFLPAKYFNSIVLVWHIRGAGEQLHTNQTPHPAMSRMKPWALNVYRRTYAFCRERLARLPKRLQKICNPKRKPRRLRPSASLFTHLLMNRCFLHKDIVFTCPVQRPLAAGNNGVFLCDLYPEATMLLEILQLLTEMLLSRKSLLVAPLMLCSHLQVQFRSLATMLFSVYKRLTLHFCDTGHDATLKSVSAAVILYHLKSTYLHFLLDWSNCYCDMLPNCTDVVTMAANLTCLVYGAPPLFAEIKSQLSVTPASLSFPFFFNLCSECLRVFLLFHLQRSCRPACSGLLDASPPGDADSRRQCINIALHRC